MATHSSILAWEIPWTEEPGGLQSVESQRVRHDRVTNTDDRLSTLNRRHLFLTILETGKSKITVLGSSKFVCW